MSCEGFWQFVWCYLLARSMLAAVVVALILAIPLLAWLASLIGLGGGALMRRVWGVDQDHVEDEEEHDLR